MVFNHKKTKILCVSDAMSYRAGAFILDSNSNQIDSSSTGKIKVLGLHMDGRPPAYAHVEALRARMREMSWVLRHLKLSGFNEEKLATVYRVIIRPILDLSLIHI